MSTTPHTTETAELEYLRGQVKRLGGLANEHVACSGCPTPWWLHRWLEAVEAGEPR